MSSVSRDDLEVLVELFERSHWQSLDLQIEGTRLSLSKTGKPAVDQVVPPPQAAASPESAVLPASAALESQPVAAPPARPTTVVREGWISVKAPNLGTFYRSPKPGAAPFIEIGQRVGPKTEVCMLEVMKLFTSVVAGVSGTVREILISDGELVEHDQVLMLIEPGS